MEYGVELLEAYGFERLEDDLWRFTREIAGDGDFGSQNVVVVVHQAADAYEGHVPLVGYDIPGLNQVPPCSLFYRSADVRDMIALAQNCIGNATMEATGQPADDGFMDDHDDMFITSPFQSNPWAGYSLTEKARPNDSHLELEDPSKAYARYEEWRDAFAEKVMSEARNSAPRA